MVRRQLGDEHAFLRQLALQADWQPLPGHQLRAEQLSQKTNQFNLSYCRYQAAELVRLVSEGATSGWPACETDSPITA